jgi:dTDP-4-amino-4,6-dideoxy-D-galactose acyltransferase
LSTIERWASEVPGSYLPYPFVREFPEALQRALLKKRMSGPADTLDWATESGNDFLAGRRLSWDSDFFGVNTYRLDLAQVTDVVRGKNMIAELEGRALSKGPAYCFAPVPSDQLALLDALGQSGWSLLETRLVFCFEQVNRFEPKQRPAVRRATAQDAEPLADVAALTRNPFDRFHADPFFKPERVDELMRAWVRGSIAGRMADGLLMPAHKPHAFVTFKDEGVVGDHHIWRFPIAAVAPEATGWYYRLIAGALCEARDQGATHVICTTQADNRAVIRVYEKLSAYYGQTILLLRKVLR